MPAFCSTRRKQVQNGAVGDAEESDRADEGGEAGDGKPAVAAEIELPRPLPLNSHPPGNKRSPISMISCVSASPSFTSPPPISTPRYSCGTAIYDTSNHVCARPFGRTAPIGHAETDRSTGRWHRLTCRGPEGSRGRFAEPTARRSSTHPLRSSRDRKIVRHSPQRRSGCLYSSLLSFGNGQTQRPNIC